MAKMFYSIEETAQKLGVTVDAVKEMAAQGKLQQYRDRDKVMFKVDQVDGMAKSEDTGTLSLADTGDPDTLDLQDSSVNRPADTGTGATGISVFDADEVESADPLAQTVVSSTIENVDDDLTLDSVGSGSGLLDLTRESDDTSLGAAELLEEISLPGGGDTGADTGGTGFANIFDSAGGSEGTSAGIAAMEGASAGALATPTVYYSDSDSIASGWAGGLMLGSLVALVITLMIAVAAITYGFAPLAQTIASNMPMYLGGLVGVTFLCGIVGFFIGKSASR